MASHPAFPLCRSDESCIARQVGRTMAGDGRGSEVCDPAGLRTQAADAVPLPRMALEPSEGKTAGIATAVDETPPLDTSVLFEDAKEKAREEIDTYLDTLSGYEFQNLVAALLEGMGYATSTVSKPGSDGGTDI